MPLPMDSAVVSSLFQAVLRWPSLDILPSAPVPVFLWDGQFKDRRIRPFSLSLGTSEILQVGCAVYPLAILTLPAYGNIHFSRNDATIWCGPTSQFCPSETGSSLWLHFVFPKWLARFNILPCLLATQIFFSMKSVIMSFMLFFLLSYLSYWCVGFIYNFWLIIFCLLDMLQIFTPPL